MKRSLNHVPSVFCSSVQCGIYSEIRCVCGRQFCEYHFKLHSKRCAAQRKHDALLNGGNR